MNQDSTNGDAPTGASTSTQRQLSLSQPQSQPLSQHHQQPYPPVSRSLNSDRTSPLNNNTTTTTTATTFPSAIATAPAPAPAPATTASMAASVLNTMNSFPHQQGPYAPSFARYHERDPTTYTGLPYGAPVATAVRISGLSADDNQRTVGKMCMFSTEVVSIELMPPHDEDASTRSALLRLRSMAGARHVKDTLHGRNGLSVEICSPHSSGAASSATSPSTAATQAPRFDGAGFPSLDNTSPPNGNQMGNGFYSETNYAYGARHPFSPQSSIGHHLGDQPRMSGKDLITNNAQDDDDTGDILKDPRAYAENGSFHTQRRSTMPNVSLSSMMGNLTLNTNAGTNGTRSGQMFQPRPQPPVPHSHSMSPTVMNGYHQPRNWSGLGHGHAPPPANPADQHPPCNTLYVGNLPMDASEDELRKIFQPARGYRRMCFRTKANGPMCFVEFEDIVWASKALKDLYGVMLPNSKKGGIRLSFSKNPLGVRNPQVPGQGPTGPLGGLNGMPGGPSANGFAPASGPPPGFPAPPGLGPNRPSNGYSASTMSNGYSTPTLPNGYSTSNTQNGYSSGAMLNDHSASTMSNGMANGNASYQTLNHNGNIQQGLDSAAPFFSRNPWNTTSYSAMHTTNGAASSSGASNGIGSNSMSPNSMGPNGRGPNGTSPIGEGSFANFNQRPRY